MQNSRQPVPVQQTVYGELLLGVNLRHYLNQDGAIAFESSTGRRLAEYFAAIVEKTSSDV